MFILAVLSPVRHPFALLLMESMNSVRTFSAATEDALWQQVAADLSQQPDLLTYAADLTEGSYLVRLTLEIDLGGAVLRAASKRPPSTAWCPRRHPYAFPCTSRIGCTRLASCWA